MLLLLRCALVVAGSIVVDSALAYHLGQAHSLVWWQRIAVAMALLVGMGLAWNGAYPKTVWERHAREPRRVLGDALVFAVALVAFGTIVLHRVA